MGGFYSSLIKVCVEYILMNIEDRDVHLVNFNVSHTYSFYLYNCFM